MVAKTAGASCEGKKDNAEAESDIETGWFWHAHIGFTYVAWKEET